MKIIFFVIFLFLALPVHAESTTLSISPPVVEIMLAPNKQATQTFSLRTEGENLDLIPELHLAKPSDTTGHTTIDPNPYNQSSTPLSVSISGPNHSPTLTFEAANTDLAQDIYLALVFLPKNDSLGEDRTTLTLPSVAALILVTVNPSSVMSIDLEIKDFSLPYIHDTWDPLTLAPLIKNNADIMIRPQTNYQIISPSGKTLLSLDLDSNLILGHSSRTLTPLLSWSPTWTNIGPHTLRLNVKTQGGTPLTQLEKTIWLFPIKGTIIFSLGIVLLLTLASKRTRFKVV